MMKMIVALALLPFLVCFPAGAASDRPDGNDLASIVRKPVLKQKIASDEPVKISLKKLLKENEEYEVWIDDGDCCRPLGEVTFGDITMVFVKKNREDGAIEIKLPMIPEGEMGKADDHPPVAPEKRIININDNDIHIPAWHDGRIPAHHPDRMILVPNKDLQKKRIPHSTIPLYKRDLPDGGVEFKITHPDGSESIETIPPLP